MNDCRVDPDDEIELIDDGGRIGEVVELGTEIEQVGRRSKLADLRNGGSFLQRDKPNTRDIE